jgi:threonine dehydrogenase-like Zn-dependent dehydrogenase
MNNEALTPVTIVGAGPVGLMLANLLAAYQVPVVSNACLLRPAPPGYQLARTQPHPPL